MGVLTSASQETVLVGVRASLFIAVAWEIAFQPIGDAYGEQERYHRALYEDEELFGTAIDRDGEESPLFGLYAEGYGDLKTTANASRERCPTSCSCPSSSNDDGHLHCKGGVSIVRDGCNCCFVCARQQGDLCDYRNRCDEDKLMRCDYTAIKARGRDVLHRVEQEEEEEEGDNIGRRTHIPRGICRAKFAKPCDVNGKIYQDGEHFYLNCSQLCTCQNGNYACASLCPQEDVAPSGGHCRHPKLTAIGGRCCKEWICPHAQNRRRMDDDHLMSNSDKDGGCAQETTGWSACSVTCDVGWSIRLTNDKDCAPVQERRLCIVRPCRLKDKHMGRECKNTWRQDDPMRLSHAGCTSVKEYRPKYCSTCKKHRCCRPDLTKTLTIEMNCESNRTITEKFMWIKSCRCKTSYCS